MHGVYDVLSELRLCSKIVFCTYFGKLECGPKMLMAWMWKGTGSSRGFKSFTSKGWSRHGFASGFHALSAPPEVAHGACSCGGNAHGCAEATLRACTRSLCGFWVNPVWACGHEGTPQLSVIPINTCSSSSSHFVAEPFAILFERSRYLATPREAPPAEEGWHRLGMPTALAAPSRSRAGNRKERNRC